jgi:hypothetical protein
MADTGRWRGRRLIEPFDYEGVTLLASRFKDQVEGARALYGGIPNDDILKGFRAAAGLPAPGAGMGGWCKSTSAVIFGQLLSGMARLGRATSDQALIGKAAQLVDGWRATIGPDGDLKLRPYDWEKLVCGLVDLHCYAGLPAALPLLEEATRWASRRFDRSRPEADNYNFQGVRPGNASEWYTLPENLYRGYLAGGSERLLRFADEWRYESYWRRFERSAEPEEVVPVHAYSHVNSFSSAAMAYAVTGEERYLRICVNAYDFLRATQCYATGGFGPDERLMPPDGSLGRSLELYGAQAEIPCGTWAATKLSRYLLCFTGEARFGDWIETNLYNAIGASLPTQPNGDTFYYGDYRLSSGIKQFYWHQWPCCAGTYWQTVADYHDIVYFRDPAGIYVNLFLPSEVRWAHHGAGVLMRQETLYPDADTTALAFELERPLAFRLRIRVPAWATAMQVAVNGAALSVDAVPGRWASIEREWRPGDRLTVRVPMRLRMVPVDPQHPDRVAICFGPQVLAQDEACCRRPFALEDGASLESRLVRDDERVRFRFVDTAPERHQRTLQPLREIPGFWPYWVYFDLKTPPLY